MNRGYAFGGANILHPGAYTEMFSDKTISLQAPAENVLAIVSTSQGGPVGSILEITSDKQIKQNLIGGDGANLALIAFEHGIDRLLHVRVNKATPAGVDFGDLALEWNNPGLNGRSAQATRLVSADRADGVDWIVHDTQSQIPERYFALGPILDVRYLGTGTSPKAEITEADGEITITLSALTNVPAPNTPKDVLTFSSSNVDNFDVALQTINTSGLPWRARAVGDTTAPLTDLAEDSVPAVEGVVTLNTGRMAEYRALLTGTLATPILKPAVSPDPDAEPPAPAVVPNAIYGTKYFTGGSEGGVPTLGDWVDALALLENVRVTHIALGSGNDDVVSAFTTHLERMEHVKKRRERLGFAGPDRQSTKANLITRLEDMSQKHGTPSLALFGNEPKFSDLKTRKVDRFPAYYYACAAAALKAANEPAYRLTNKRTRLMPHWSFEYEERESLLKQGVNTAYIHDDFNYPVFNANVTTYTTNNDFCKADISGRDQMFFYNRSLRLELETKVGEIVSEEEIGVLADLIENFNESLVRGTDRNPRGILTGGENPETGEAEPPFKNIKVETLGMTVTGIKQELHFVGGMDLIFVTSFVTPVKITARR